MLRFIQHGFKPNLVALQLSCSLACGGDAHTAAIPLIVPELAGELVPDSCGDPLLDPISVHTETWSEVSIWLTLL